MCEEHEIRGRLLAQVTETLGSSLDVERMLDVVSEEVVPVSADLFVVALLTELGELRPAAFRHADPTLGDQVELVRTLIEPIPGGLVERVLTGAPAILVQADAADLDDTIPAETRTCLEHLGIRSLIIGALRVRDEVLGVLCAARTSGSERAFEGADLALMDDLAGRAAQAIDSAQLFHSVEAAEQRFEAAFEYAPIGVALTRAGVDGRAIWSETNPALGELLGRRRGELVDRPVTDYVHPDDRSDLDRRIARLLAKRGQRSSAEVRLLRPDGTTRLVTVQSVVIDGGTVLSQFVDITDQRRSESELTHLAQHDPLTGLLNRPAFEEAMERTLADVRRHGDDGAVVMIDLDNFKGLNDSYSTAVGDEMIRTVGLALKARLRESDAIARLGDDEFGVLLPRTNPEAVETVVEELLEAIRTVSIRVGDRSARTSGSAGVRTFGRTSLRSRGDLLGETDAGMLEAKEGGRNRAVMVRSGEENPSRVRMHMRWSERIREAIERDRFVLYEQPILRLADGVIDRSELLIRMLSDDDEPIAPGIFLPVAERFSLIEDIDRWVVTNAIGLLTRRWEAGVNLGVSVNLSADSLTNEAQVDAIAEEICAASIDPARLAFEITETAAIDDLGHAARMAARLRSLGCSLALDDFGSGFSSFAYLRQLPVDVIKIDGAFVRDIATSQSDQLTVRAIVDIAQGLGKETVAEFVEDRAVANLLEHLEVDSIQGYFVDRPRPAQIDPRWETRE